MRRTLLLVFVLTAACAGQRRLDLTNAGQGLTRVTSDREGEYRPAISPDGATLLFDTRRSRDATVIGVDPNSGARRTVYTSLRSRSQDATWDPQGKFFVFSSDQPGELSLVRSLSNSANAAISIIVSGEVAPLAHDPTLSPDGSRVAFSTLLRDVWSLAVANIDGSNLTILGEGLQPTWSPDGKQLAFVRVASNRAHIFSLEVETGTNVVQVTSGETDNVNPAWSPDSRYVVFASNRSSRKAPRGFSKGRREVTGRFNLFVIKPDGTGVVQLTDGDSQAIHPAWSKDGWIYFSSNQAGNFDIWRLRPGAELHTSAEAAR